MARADVQEWLHMYPHAYGLQAHGHYPENYSTGDGVAYTSSFGEALPWFMFIEWFGKSYASNDACAILCQLIGTGLKRMKMSPPVRPLEPDVLLCCTEYRVGVETSTKKPNKPG